LKKSIELPNNLTELNNNHNRKPTPKNLMKNFDRSR